MNNKKFTLIELIVVIAILGILASLIVPNISSFKGDATVTAIASNVRNFQTAVDMYSLKNNSEYPTANQPTEFIPEPIDFNKLDKKYLKTLPKTEGVKYWVDFQGRVWASTIDSPKNILNNNGTITWQPVEGAEKYQVFEVQGYQGTISTLVARSKSNLILKVETTTTTYNGEVGKLYVVNTIDKQNFQSAPTGIGYQGYNIKSQTENPIQVPKIQIQLTAPELGWRRIDDRDSKINYIGTWTLNNLAGSYANTNIFIPAGTSVENVKASKVKFKFYGTKIRFIHNYWFESTTDARYKIDGVEVGSGSIKGTAVTAEDLRKQMLIFEKTGLSLGIHEVEIYSGDGVRFDFDAIDIDDTGYMITPIGQSLTAPETVWQRIDDTNTKIKYNGNWIKTTLGTSSYNGGHASSNVIGNTIDFKFYGTKLRIMSPKNFDVSNNVQITIDDQVYTFSEYSPTLLWQTLVFEKTGLNLGEHTVQIKVLNSNAVTLLDSIDIDDTGYMMTPIGQLLTAPETGWQRVDDTNTKIQYIGNWTKTTSGTSSYNGGHASSNTIGNTINFKFYGTKLRIMSPKNSDISNNVQITIDDQVYTFSEYSPTLLWQTLVFEKTGLNLENHTVQIKVLNSNAVTLLDSIDIDETGYLVNP